ncbi:MAG TPA: protease, partial [Bryobacteraceae bacterium]|nr:protease [Bryobacteraceae bacterium]
MITRLTLVLLAASALAAGGPSIYRNPTLSKTTIVFEHASDLWSVPRSGGTATRLTSGPGVEAQPIFSPDGSQVAFTGEYDGNVDVYIIPAAGGVPKRVTYHPSADTALGWTPDGKRILFTSSRASAQYTNQLFTISPDGGPEDRILLPIGYEAAYSPDGTQIAYVPMRRAFSAWKRYRGGTTTPVWIADLATSKVEKLPRPNSNDYNPMWTGGKVWFLSDREGPVTLFSYDPKAKKVVRAIENKGLDFKSAGAASDAIAVEQFGSIHIYDLKSGKLTPVSITVSGDMPEVRERLVNVSSRLRSAGISPSGARAVFEARGEILTVPAEKGDPRNITNSTAVMERDPAWSPDGQSIAYFSDASGEYELHIAPQNGVGDVKKIKLADKPTFYS